MFTLAGKFPTNFREAYCPSTVGGAFDPEAFDVAALNKRVPKDVELFASWR
ncbi:MAG: hypothetical protein V1790_14705 [Planctomycetota bacterium]